jgi:hypothetical protein
MKRPVALQVRFPSHLSPRAFVALPRKDCKRGGYYYKVYVFFNATRRVLAGTDVKSVHLKQRHLMQVLACVPRWRRRPISVKLPGTAVFPPYEIHARCSFAADVLTRSGASSRANIATSLHPKGCQPALFTRQGLAS